MRRSFAFALLVIAPNTFAQTITFKEGLGISVNGNPRTPVRTDPVEYRFLMEPVYRPTEGETIGKGTWAKVSSNAEGQFTGSVFRGGYAWFTVTADKSKVMLLEANGHGMVYVNGEPRGGDVYQFGYVSLPVNLKQGENRFLFSMGRGALRAQLVDPPAPLSFDLRDATTPDVVVGRNEISWAGVNLRNAQNTRIETANVEVVSKKGAKIETKVGPIEPLTTRKVGIRLRLDGSESYTLRVKFQGKTVHTDTLKLRLRQPSQAHKVTFLSDIDGSVQYYGVLSSSNPGDGQALFLSLHGASVEGIGQAEAYAPKSWGTLVAATNRRPFGFDWEDIGRLDALEVLDQAKKRFKPDPNRVYLTGHSMGGHGTWQIGVHFPDLFAAIAPSAGWISFKTYGGGASYPNPSLTEQMLLRAMSPSDTLNLKYNYAQQGIYTVHGDADDNVPVTQARTMRTELSSFHRDINGHEQPGAGHWWDNSDEPGAECVDWPGVFSMFARRRIPASSEVRELDFSTSSPGVSASNHWVTIEQQETLWTLSRVQLKADPVLRRIRGTSQNVQRMTLRLDALQRGSSLSLDIDGQTLKDIAWPASNALQLEKSAKGWVVSSPLSPNEKNPVRYGAFKDVFKNRVVFVYGTTGEPELAAWTRLKARFDAETLAYRGNGSVDVIPDTQFSPETYKDRNVLLYGNPATNSAFAKTLSNEVLAEMSDYLAPQRMPGYPDYGTLFIAPRVGSNTASVGVIGGATLRGMRLTERVPIFTSGASIPDIFVHTPRSLLEGTKGVPLIGFFGRDWTLKNGDIARQDL
jgi:dienelactone hydrolase